MKTKEEIEHKIKQLEKFQSEINDETMIHKWEVVLNYLRWVITE